MTHLPRLVHVSMLSRSHALTSAALRTPSRATSTSMLAQEKPAAQAAASAKLGKALLLEAEDCPLELFEG